MDAWLESIRGEMVIARFRIGRFADGARYCRARLYAWDKRGVILSDPEKEWGPSESALFIPWNNLAFLMRSDRDDILQPGQAEAK